MGGGYAPRFFLWFPPCGQYRDRHPLRVLDPVIATVKVQDEWEQALAVLDPDIRRRMVLDNAGRAPKEQPCGGYLISDHFASIERPNYRFEVMRLLIEAAAHHKPQAAVGIDNTPRYFKDVGRAVTRGLLVAM